MKPRMRLVRAGLWICYGADLAAFGTVPHEAYTAWRDTWLRVHSGWR